MAIRARLRAPGDLGHPLLRRARCRLDVHGIPPYGQEPFEEIGLYTSVPLLVAVLLVCIAELVMGWLLWTGQRTGPAVSFGLLPIELAFWIGFALPLGPVFGLLRTWLLIATLRASSPSSPRP